MSYYTQRQNGYGQQPQQPPAAPSSRYFDYAKWQQQQQAAKASAAKPSAKVSTTTSSVVRPQATTSSSAYGAQNTYASAAAYKPGAVAQPAYVTYNPYNSAGPSYAQPSSSSVSYYGGGSVPYAAPAASKPPAVSQPQSYYTQPTNATKPPAYTNSYASAAGGSSYAAPYGSSNSYVIGGSGKPQATATNSVVRPPVAPVAVAPPVASPSAAISTVKPQVSDPYAQYASDKKSNGITRAAFVGINYTGQRGLELKGCVNDVTNSIKLFKEMGANLVEEQNLRVLVDSPGARRRPTKVEMLAAMEWLTKDCKEGDVLWFHYSGHGSQEKDTSGTEKDGMNESIIPLDYTTKGSIIDDDLYKLLVQPLKKGVILYAIFDCCHSGTILDLRYIFDESTGKLVVDTDYRERRDDEGTVFMLSGCMSTQTSADLPPDVRQGLKAQSVGAMTSSYLPILSQGFAWPLFIKSLRTGLKKSKLQQVPQFEISRNVNLKEPAFGAAFPMLVTPTGRGAGADDQYVPHDDVKHHCSKHTWKLKKKAAAAAAAAEATANASGYGESQEDEEECDEDHDDHDQRGIGRAQARGMGGVPIGNNRPVYATAAGNPYAAASIASVARYPGQPQPQQSMGRTLPGVGPQSSGIAPVVRGNRRF